MGQAKNRGSRADRIAAAQARNLALGPGTVSCQTCGHELSEFVLKEVTAAGALWECRCPECKVLSGALVPSAHCGQERVLLEARKRLNAIAQKDPKNKHKLTLSFAPGPAPTAGDPGSMPDTRGPA